MGYPLATRELHQWAAREPPLKPCGVRTIGSSWSSHGVPIGAKPPGDPYGRLMGDQLSTHGLPIGDSWTTYGRLVGRY